VHCTGAFEVYKDYQSMKKKIADYNVDFSGFEQAFSSY
jgi:hypothetical protein